MNTLHVCVLLRCDIWWGCCAHRWCCGEQTICTRHSEMCGRPARDNVAFIVPQPVHVLLVYSSVILKRRILVTWHLKAKNLWIREKTKWTGGQDVTIHECFWSRCRWTQRCVSWLHACLGKVVKTYAFQLRERRVVSGWSITGSWWDERLVPSGLNGSQYERDKELVKCPLYAS